MPAGFEIDEVYQLETNLDDCPGEVLGAVMERLFAAGALDVWFEPITMKKNRPGVLLSILCEGVQKGVMLDLLFTETTTLGVRTYEVSRRALERTVTTVQTSYGPIDVKVGHLNGRVVNAMPEFDQCREAAERSNVPLKEVEEAARLALRTTGKR